MGLFKRETPEERDAKIRENQERTRLLKSQAELKEAENRLREASNKSNPLIQFLHGAKAKHNTYGKKTQKGKYKML